MSTLVHPGSRSGAVPWRGLGWIAGAIAVLFSLLAIEHAVALAGGRVELQARLMAWLTSDAYIFGEGNLRGMEVWYRDALGRMSLHMVLGAVALGLGVLQFMELPRFGGRFGAWVSSGFRGRDWVLFDG